MIDLLKKRLHLNVRYIDTPLEYRGKVPFLLKKSYDVKVIKIEHLECVVLTVDEENVKSIKKHFKLFSDALLLPVILYPRFPKHLTRNRENLHENPIV